MTGQHWRVNHLLDGGVMVTMEHRQCTARSRSFPLEHGEQERHSDSDCGHGTHSVGGELCLEAILYIY